MQKYKLKQDKKNTKDISELYNRKLNSLSNLKKLKNYAVSLNTELYLLEKDNIERLKLSQFKFKSNDEDNISADTEKILFKVSRNITKNQFSK